MSIGLYDVDMVLYNQTPFSLELMKYATYYKNKNQIVSMANGFTPNKYNTFILRKDYQDGKFPAKIENYDNIIYGGHGFSGAQYIPLDESIEKTKADTSIYEKFRLRFGETNKLIAAFDVMMHAEHLRISLDGKTIWPDFEKQITLDSSARTIFFHDYNLNEIEGARDLIEDLLYKSEYGVTSGFLAMKFPVVLTKYEDLLYWCSFKSSSSFYNVEYRGPLTDEELYDFIKMQFIRTNPSKLEYNITEKYKDQDDFLVNGLMNIYNQVLFLRMNKVRFLLKYDNDFFVDKRWSRLIDLFNCYLNVTTRLNRDHFNRVINSDSLYNFCKSLEDIRLEKDYFNKQEARELFTLVRDTNQDLFKSFYQAHIVQLIGGEFINDAT